MDLNEATSVGIGEPAPDFSLTTNTGEKWRLSDHLGSVVALLFYPKDETLVCTKQMCSVRDHWTDYLETKAQIVGISPGTVSEHSDFSRRHKLPITLLADSDRKVTEDYAFHWLFPTIFTRSVFVIDAKGVIRSRRVMLRAFRPTDRSVIASIYEARADQLGDRYKSISEKMKSAGQDQDNS